MLGGWGGGWRGGPVLKVGLSVYNSSLSKRVLFYVLYTYIYICRQVQSVPNFLSESAMDQYAPTATMYVLV